MTISHEDTSGEADFLVVFDRHGNPLRAEHVDGTPFTEVEEGPLGLWEEQSHEVRNSTAIGTMATETPEGLCCRWVKIGGHWVYLCRPC